MRFSLRNLPLVALSRRYALFIILHNAFLFDAYGRTLMRFYMYFARRYKNTPHCADAIGAPPKYASGRTAVDASFAVKNTTSLADFSLAVYFCLNA